jgi:hypothetical protein
MTAILEKLRRLEARYKRGDIDATEYAHLRARIKGSVEEVEPVVLDTQTAPAPEINRPEPQLSSSMKWGLGLVVCLVVLGLCMGLALMLFVDVSFGLTLGVTLLAALTVALFRSLEEEQE